MLVSGPRFPPRPPPVQHKPSPCKGLSLMTSLNIKAFSPALQFIFSGRGHVGLDIGSWKMCAKAVIPNDV